ncbi:MAG: tetratricopeptide repeat protein, partial [Thiohalocapsa sp.]|nr:tetratricopeptide repeat protein [Thiohalocapsa sp.]MCF7992570.1 tetratricopeptide repeat protein [Thiohalocapsa sp.]
MVKKAANARSRSGAKSKPGPEPSQLKSVERLLEEGRYGEAVGRLERLVARFPDHGGLRRLLVEAHEQAGSPQAAAVTAFAWAQRRPNSLPAQQTLLDLAIMAGQLLLADRVAERVRALGEPTRGFPLDEQTVAGLLLQMDGSRSPRADEERFEIGKLHIDGFDFEAAAHWLEGLPQTPARNNRALALFHAVRIEEALAAFEEAWRNDAQNLFALGWCVRLRLFVGDREGARAGGEQLGAGIARRVDDALSQVDALLLLQQDQTAWNAFERARAAAWFDADASPSGAALRHFGACAAARLGKTEKARSVWESAEALQPDLEQAVRNLDRLAPSTGESRYPEIFDLHQCLPLLWLERLKAEPAMMDESLTALGASDDYLYALYLGGSQMLRMAAGMLLQSRVEAGDSGAAERLRDLARMPVGSEEERFGLLRFLEEQSPLSGGQPGELWNHGSVRPVQMIKTEIYREPQDSELPEDLEHLFGEASALFGEQRYEQAEQQLRLVLERAPDHRVALGNLAAVCDSLGRRDEARLLLHRLVDKHPDYLFGRCNLVRSLILAGELDEAARLLPRMEDYERLHVEDLFALMGSVAMLQSARGDEAAARAVLDMLQGVVETEEDARRYGQISRLVEVARTA